MCIRDRNETMSSSKLLEDIILNLASDYEKGVSSRQSITQRFSLISEVIDKSRLTLDDLKHFSQLDLQLPRMLKTIKFMIGDVATQEDDIKEEKRIIAKIDEILEQLRRISWEKLTDNDDFVRIHKLEEIKSRVAKKLDLSQESVSCELKKRRLRKASQMQQKSLPQSPSEKKNGEKIPTQRLKPEPEMSHDLPRRSSKRVSSSTRAKDTPTQVQTSFNPVRKKGKNINLLSSLEERNTQMREETVSHPSMRKKICRKLFSVIRDVYNLSLIHI
eukprot:TRINITY_DN2853_c0_g1_i25.p1 TRINITY_DN2853_c0_g1~~TRINITY_DN2853_c0_g1_i25.p1  ORF type:complete len:293 (+),score=53.75 TRINITY_DN2853_c0_g1_i25:60-881(+)